RHRRQGQGREARPPRRRPLRGRDQVRGTCRCHGDRLLSAAVRAARAGTALPRHASPHSACISDRRRRYHRECSTVTSGTRAEREPSTVPLVDEGGALAGVRVVETACGVAGPYLAKLLGDLGADVAKVEPPGGDPARRHGPFPGDRPDPARSALFIHLNAAKRLAPPAELDDLVAEADVVVDDGRLDAAALRAAHPRLVVASVTPYGLTG